MQRRSLSRYVGMNRGGLFSGNWQLKGSAIIGSIFIVMLLVTMVFVVRATPEALEEARRKDPDATESSVIMQMLLVMAMLMSPMIIGNILNWIASLKQMKPLLVIAGIMYLLVIPMEPMFSLFAIVPAVLAFIAAHKIGKKPELRHL